MQWNNDRRYQQDTTTADVYQDVATPYSATLYGTEQTQEFSLEAIRQKLGAFNPVEQEEETVVKADAQPSEQTLKMSYARDYASEKASVKGRISTRTKIAAASYAIVVLALIIAVALCGVAVTDSFGAASELNAQYVEANTQLAELTAQVTTEDYAVLAEKAAELGYIDASRSNTQTYTEIETRPAQNFTVETNWFDSLCDWLSGAFGG